MRIMKFRLLSIILCLGLLLPGVDASARKQIKAVVVTGQNNHFWKVSSQAFKIMLEDSGLFTVDIAVSPEAGKDMSGFNVDFSKYGVVIVDYNGDMWSDQMKKDFETYAQNGGGIIFYHAADNSFRDWAEYSKMNALGGWGGRNEKDGPYVYWQEGGLVRDNSAGFGGSHGPRHEFLLTNRDNNHPVTKGLPEQWMHGTDELYDRMRGPGNIDDLLYTSFSYKEKRGSGREEPLVFSVDYGKARIFHCMLGHAGETLENNPAMQCAGFQTLILRAAEWCATGKVKQKVPADFPTAEKTSFRMDYRQK